MYKTFALPQPGFAKSPLSLFISGVEGAYYDFNDLSTLFTTYNGSTNVSSVGDPIGRAEDKSGNDNHATQSTAGSRPVLGIQPKSGVRNKLTYTEQFDTDWGTPHGTVGSTGAVTPPTAYSTKTVWELEQTLNTGNDTNRLDQNTGTLDTSKNYIFWAVIKPETGRTPAIGFGPGVSDNVVSYAESTQTITVGGDAGVLDGGYTELDNDWIVLWGEVTGSYASVSNFRIFSDVSSGDLGQKLHVILAQGEATEITNYQRVGAWYDVTEGTVTTDNHVYFAAPDGVDDYLTIPGSASAFKFLHDGTGGYVSSAVQFGIVDDPDDFYTLLSSSNGSSETGITLGWDDRSGSSESESPELTVSNGTSNIVSIGVDDTMPANAPAVLSCFYDIAASTDAEIDVNVATEASGDDAGTPDTGVSDNDLHIFDDQASSLPMSGKLFSLLIRDGVPSSASQYQLTQYQAQKAGVTL